VYSVHFQAFSKLQILILYSGRIHASAPWVVSLPLVLILVVFVALVLLVLVLLVLVLLVLLALVLLALVLVLLVPQVDESLEVELWTIVISPQV
jgi:hypothetical protein